MNRRMRRWLCQCILMAASACLAHASSPALVLIRGAAGADEFRSRFSEAADHVRAAAEPAGFELREVTDRESLRAALVTTHAKGDLPLWIVFIGHGTWDGRDARLNLNGPDVTATELAEWLAPIERPLVFIHGGSASGPFVPSLSRPGRVIVTATETGDEVNYARFGERFTHAIGSSDADLDRDGRTSVLEAFLHAAQAAQAFYIEEGRLATEHAMIDDNGDGRGTPAEWFHGTRVETRSADGASVDGSLARSIALIEPAMERALSGAMRRQRDLLEQELESLQLQRGTVPPETYLFELERILRQLTPLYVPRVDPGDS